MMQMIQQNTQINFPKAYCKNNHQGVLACINKYCNEQAIICRQDSCQCSKRHPSCKFISTYSIIEKMFNKRRTITEREKDSFELIQSKVNDLIESLSKIREELAITKEASGLEKNSVLLYTHLTSRINQKITGKKMLQIRNQLQFGQGFKIASVQSVQFIFKRRQQQFNKLCQTISSLYKGFQSISQQHQNYLKNAQFPYFNKNVVNEEYPQMHQIHQLSKLPKLNIITITKPYENGSSQIIKNITNLKHLTLGINQNNCLKLPQQLISEISNTQSLKSLTILKDSNLKEEEFVKIIQNNKQLTNICIAGRMQNYVKDPTIQILAQELKLKSFSISGFNSIRGINFQNFSYLKKFSCHSCELVKKEHIIKGISCMKELTYLNLNASSWVDDTIAEQIGKSCLLLKHLIVSYTRISEKGILHFKSLKLLITFICGGYGTKINGQSLIELTKQAKLIRKLGITQVNINNEELLKINENCEQKITHLNIQRCNQLTVESLLAMKNLQFVKSSSNKIQRDYKMPSKCNITVKLKSVFDYL